MKHNYKEYFKKHYNYAFTTQDIENYQNWFTAQWNFINTHITFKKNERDLEIGAGIGGFYAFLKEKNINYVGLEADKQAMKFANAFFKTDIFQANFLEDFKTNQKFDKIFAFEVLEHLENPSACIDKIYTLLKPGGIFCGTTPYPYYKNIMADQTHLSVLHPENWRRLFLLHGFKDITLYPMSFLPYIWRLNKNLNYRIPFFVPFNYLVSTCLIIAKK